jgi:hypothetical protein
MFGDVVKTELYQPREWPEHVRKFYSEWLDETGWRPNDRRSFDRFVRQMEEMIGDYLSDQTLDHSRFLTPKEDAT